MDSIANRGKLKGLDGLRGLAALYVVAHHIWQHSGTALVSSFYLKALFRHGLLAVIAFFLISGFVIEYSFSKFPGQTFKTFFLKRFFRIYPLFAFALAAAYAVGCLHFMQWMPVRLDQLFGNLLMLQGFDQARAGFGLHPYYDNGPLWSLSYEWWFYMSYFVIRRQIPGTFQMPFVLLLSTLAFLAQLLIQPTQVSSIFVLFPIWWIGVELARFYSSAKSNSAWRSPKIHVFLAISLLVSAFAVRHTGRSLDNNQQLLNVQSTCYGYAALLLVVGLYWQTRGFVHYGETVGRFSPVADISYSIYVLHYPVVVLGGTMLAAWIPAPLAFLATLVTLFALSYLLEVQLLVRVRHRAKPKPAPIPSAAPIPGRIGIELK